MKEDITGIFNEVVEQKKLEGDLSKDVWVAYNPTKEDLEKLDPYTYALGFSNTISVEYIEDDIVVGLAFDPVERLFGFLREDDTEEEIKETSETGKLIKLSPRDFVKHLSQRVESFAEYSKTYFIAGDVVTKESLAQLNGVTTWYTGEDPSALKEATGLDDISGGYLLWSPSEGLTWMDPFSMVVLRMSGMTLGSTKFIKVDSFEEFVDKIKEGE